MNHVNQLADATCRIEHLIWIPGAVANVEALPNVFEEQFFECLPDNPNQILIQQLPVLKPFTNGRADVYELAEALVEVEGFLIQASTPVKDFHDRNSFVYSWGRYTTEWLYAEDFQSIPRVILEWVAQWDAEQYVNQKMGTA